MSDISIPGVTASKYKTDELIKGLMKVERVPRERADKDLQTYKKEQSAWRTVNQSSITLRDSARALYSFNNPFTEKLAESTNERAIDASATREAREQSFKVSVSQIADTDSFLSREVPKDGKVPKGNYTFSVGDKSVNFAWKGGSYREFIDALNRRSEGLIRASIIQVASETQSILIESLKTGSKERLVFSDDALAFGIENGFIKKNDSSAVTTAVTSVTSLPSTNAIIDFSAPVRAKDGFVLEYTLTVTEKSGAGAETALPTGPDTGFTGSITYGGITIENAPFDAALPEMMPELPITPVTDYAVLSLRSTKGSSMPLPPVSEGASKNIITVPLSEYGDVNALLVNNKNTDKSIEIEGIRIYDPKAAGEYTPVNPVSVAQDAIMKYEGITITRNSNTIDDLIPGVTLNLHEPTVKTETLNIRPDTDIAKEAIIGMVANYNRVIAEINILTQNKPEIITEIEYFTPEEKKAAEEKLGMMQGDTTLNGVKTALQRITSNAYTSAEGNPLIMMAQLGISTKSTAGAGVDSTRMRGYLEIDEKKLDDALKNKINDVKDLFGFDSNGDMIIDSGVAQALDANLAPYVQTGGIFATRTSGLATRITSTEKKITLLDEQLEKKESELKTKYGQMEGTLNSLQNQSNSISNFNKSGN
jgi:flagellar hook-associated protein 2